jgi:predicted enzyme related to lactoylglutathione lyase
MASVSHFAINADDVARARDFYSRVFGWKFEPWGPPGFYMVATGEGPPAPRGSLQSRRELAPGLRLNGFECTVAVDDVDAAARAIEAGGGKILMQKATIPGVGSLVFFQDTEGNVAAAMQYETTSR